MALLIRTHYKLAKTAIRENRTRSFLTCLGIAIGVASIILILSLMGSISNIVKTEVNEIGADLIVVRPATSKDAMTDIVEDTYSVRPEQSDCCRRAATQIRARQIRRAQIIDSLYYGDFAENLYIGAEPS